MRLALAKARFASTCGLGITSILGRAAADPRKQTHLAGSSWFKDQRRVDHMTSAAADSALSIEPNKYPQTRRGDVVEELHGVTVADPYRWLEDPDSTETKAFVDAQNALTKEALNKCETRDKFKELFTALYNYEKFSTPFKHADRYYFYRNSGLQQHYVLYSQPSLDGECRVLLDPNTLSKDGTVSLSGISFSEDGKVMAYSLSQGGADWVKIHALAIGEDGTPTPLDDVLDFVKFSSMAWTHDHRGFFYNRYNVSDKEEGADLGTTTDSDVNQLLYYHVLGTPQSEDTLVYADPENPNRMHGASVTDDGRYLLLSVSEGCQPANRVFYIDLALLKTADGALDFRPYDLQSGSKKLPVVKLVDNWDAEYSYVANDGTWFYFMTNLKASNYRVVGMDLESGAAPENWTDVVPEHPKDLLRSASAANGDKLVLSYLHDVKAVLQIASLKTGKVLKEVQLPGVGSVGSIHCERKQTELFFSFTGYVEPGAQYRVDMTDDNFEPTLFRRTKLQVAHDPADYVTKQLFATSKDGTKVPMFVTHRKGVELNGNNPTLLYGYGGFNISLTPGFSASRLAWMRGYNAVFAEANLRGGGEYGVAWRDAGSLLNKQNVFDDFQACAELLHQEGYSSPSKLAILGGSNGGLLVAACANQRPDLYACVLGQVGVLDMLRFHKFTIGHAWQTDFGSPDKEEDFRNILRYSPLHNIRRPTQGDQQYPAVLLFTGDHDDRVVPSHSYKFISELQHELALKDAETSPQRNPLLIRVEVRAGHGAGKPTAKVIEETSDLYSFAAKCLQAQWLSSSVSPVEEAHEA